jgi:hypothetical protein
VGNEGAFQGMITEVRNSAVCRYATNLAFNTNVAEAGLNVPYAVDGNTLHLWHFDDPLTNNTEADAVTNAPITLTNFGFPVVGGPPYTNIFLVSTPVAANLDEALQILPDNGLAAPGDSDAMAAGTEDLSPTNFYNQSSGAFTFEALVFPQGNIFSSSAGSGEWEIFCGDNSVGTRGWQFRLQNGAIPSMDFNFIDATGGGSVNLAYPLPTSGDDALATNQWYHVAVTYTGNTPTNSDPANLLSFYWTLLDPNRTTADLLATTNVSGTGTIGGTPSPAVGGSQRTTHGVGNEGAFQGMITEVRNSQVSRSATSFVFSTNVVGATPDFTEEPAASTFIGYGQTLTLNTLVSGSPAPTLQWQQTNTSGGGWINVSGQTNNTLEISDATFVDATLYRLVASNYIQGFSEVKNSTVASVTVGAAFSEVFNSGTDSNDVANTALAGSADLHYNLADSADAVNIGPAALVWDMTSYPIAAEGGIFANLDGVSQWVGPTWNDGAAAYTSPEGTYVYRTHILAASVDTTQPATVKGTVWANSTLANIVLNGVSLDISSGLTNAGTISTPFVITGGFVPGINTLDFVVPCTGGTESAVRVELSSALGQALAPGLPRILTQPTTNETVTDANVEPGTSATFSVVAIGRPPLSYQWVETNSGPVAGATNRTLSFLDPTAGAQGTNFVVVISNASGSVTSSVAMLGVVESAELPFAPDYSFAVYTNNTLDIDTSAILLAATDSNHLSLTITTDPNTTNDVALVPTVAGGSVLTYTPNQGFIGHDEFNYYLTDADGETNAGHIFIDVLPPLLPGLQTASHVGNNLVFSGSGGAPGGPYLIISTTDLTLPLSAWTTVATGNFSNTGAFSVSLPVSAANSGEYYSLELP